MIFLEESRSVLIQPKGHLDMKGGAALQQQLSMIEPKRYPVWILDMAEVEFVDSAGLFALVSGLNTASRHQCRFVICNLPPAVRLIFEITQLDQAFEVFTSQAEATASCVRSADRLPAVAAKQAA